MQLWKLCMSSTEMEFNTDHNIRQNVHYLWVGYIQCTPNDTTSYVACTLAIFDIDMFPANFIFQ